MKPPGLAHKRILVVEDDYLVAMDIARALERAGAGRGGRPERPERPGTNGPGRSNPGHQSGRRNGVPGSRRTHGARRPFYFCNGLRCRGHSLAFYAREAMREADGVGADLRGLVWMRSGPRSVIESADGAGA